MRAPELSSRLLAQHRRNKGADVLAVFGSAGVGVSLLPGERQTELLERLGLYAPEAETGPISSIKAALEDAAQTASTDFLVVMGDEPRRSPAVLAKSDPFFDALSRDPFFADRNGLLVFEPQGSGALFLDYHAAHTAADAQITRYGAWRRKA